jgi:hypothetical protein
MSTIENRYDFVFLFDCQDGNPNGDPDSDNSPRFDPETFQGLVSDVCLKRKIRDYVRYATTTLATIATKPGNGIFVLSGNTLESRQREPFMKLAGDDKIEAKGKDTKPTDIEKARQWMCQELLRCARLRSRDEHHRVQLRTGARSRCRSPLRVRSTGFSRPNTPSHARHLRARRTSSPAPERWAASTPSPTACISRMATSTRSLPRRPASRRRSQRSMEGARQSV